MAMNRRFSLNAGFGCRKHNTIWFWVLLPTRIIDCTMADDETKILSEDLNSKLDAILEGIAPLSSVPMKLGKIDERLEHIETDIRAVKASIKDLSHAGHGQTERLNGHELVSRLLSKRLSSFQISFFRGRPRLRMGTPGPNQTSPNGTVRDL